MAPGEATDMKQALFTSLQLLGLEPAVMERKWRIPFNREMFDLPNKKGFEAIMHFLFNKLNHAQCTEQFRYCWPVTDKKQEQQFRKVCNSWLLQIVENDGDAHFPRINASIFMSPGGERFVHLLFAFTRYVLFKVLMEDHGEKQKDFLRYPTVRSQNYGLGEVMSTGIQAGGVRRRRCFLEKSQQALAVQNEWKKYASEQVKSHRSLSKSIRELEHDIKDEVNFAVNRGKARGSPVACKKHRSGHLEYDYDLEGVKRAQKVHKVRQLWRQVSDFQQHLAPHREVLESVLERELEKFRLDGEQLHVTVPDMLLRSCEKEIQRRNVDNIYQGGKLNLLSLLHLWNLSLHLYIERLHTTGVADFEGVSPSVTTQLHTHTAHLANAQALRSKLEKDMIPKIKASISELKHKLDKKMLRNQSPDTIRTTTKVYCAPKRSVTFHEPGDSKSIGLGLLPPTPPMTFDPQDVPPSELSAADPRLSEGLALPADVASTPEAASRLMDSINSAMLQRLSTVTQGSPVYHPRTMPLASRLPVRGEVETQTVGKKQRTKVKPAPKHTAFTLPMDISGVSVKSTDSGTTLTESDRHVHSSAKHHLTHQQASKPEPSKKPSSAKKTKKLRTKKASPKVEKHAGVVASFTQSPQGHGALADQLVEAMMSGQEQLSAELAERLHPSTSDSISPSVAFVSRPKLEHTPPPVNDQQSHSVQSQSIKQHSPKSWKKALLHDSVGPLSSTRLDADTASKKSTTSSAQTTPRDRPGGTHAGGAKNRLFSPEESDSEGNIITVEPHQTPPAPRPLRSPKSALYHPAGPVVGSHQSPAMSLHSGWSSPGQRTPQPQRSPHGHRSFIQSPQPASQGSTPSHHSSQKSTPRLPDPRTSKLFGSSMDSSNSSGNSAPKKEQPQPTSLERDLLEWSTMDRPTDYKKAVDSDKDKLQNSGGSDPLGNLVPQPNSHDPDLDWLTSDTPGLEQVLLSSPDDVPVLGVGLQDSDGAYRNLLETDTPQLPTKSRTRLGTSTGARHNLSDKMDNQNANNYNLLDTDSKNVETSEDESDIATSKPPISLLTMTPAMGRMFAEQSAKIVGALQSSPGFQPFDPAAFEEQADGVGGNERSQDDDDDDEEERSRGSGASGSAEEDDKGENQEEEEESVRVIQFKNGAFNEFLEKSPLKELQPAAEQSTDDETVGLMNTQRSLLLGESKKKKVPTATLR